MLNVITATEGQIAKIEKKYLPPKILKKLSSKSSVNITHFGEDGFFFIELHCTGYFYEYQVRIGIPCFVGLRKGISRYDIPYPKKSAPKLYERLKEIGDEVIKDWEDGNYL